MDPLIELVTRRGVGGSCMLLQRGEVDHEKISTVVEIISTEQQLAERKQERL